MNSFYKKHLKHGATEQQSKKKKFIIENAFLRLTLLASAFADVTS
jgi:hypothetical protein